MLAWSAAAWRQGDRLVVSAKCHQAQRAGRGEFEARLRHRGGLHRVGDAQRLDRSPGPGEHHGSARVDRCDLLRIREALARRLVRCKRSIQLASTIEASRCPPARQCGSLRIAQRLVPHRGDDLFDVVVVALHSVGFGQHLGAIARCHGPIVGDRVNQTHSQRGVAANQSEPRSRDQVITGHPTTGVDPPQRDLDDVFSTSGAMRLHEIGQLLLDSPVSERLKPRPEHLTVERVCQTQRGASTGGRESDQAPRLQRLQGRRAMDLHEVVEPEVLAHREELQDLQAGSIDTSQVLGDQFDERRRSRQRSGQLPGAVDLHEHATIERAAHQLGQHLQVASGQPCELDQRPRGDRPIQRAMEQGAQLVGGQCSTSMDHGRHETASRAAMRPCRTVLMGDRAVDDQWDSGERCVVTDQRRREQDESVLAA